MDTPLYMVDYSGESPVYQHTLYGNNLSGLAAGTVILVQQLKAAATPPCKAASPWQTLTSIFINNGHHHPTSPALGWTIADSKHAAYTGPVTRAEARSRTRSGAGTGQGDLQDRVVPG